MKKKNVFIKKLAGTALAFSLALASAAGISASMDVQQAEAATGLNMGGFTIRCYPYTNSNFTVYNCTSDNRTKIGTCYGSSDLITISGVGTDGWSCITYPTSRGSKTGYCETYQLFANPDFAGTVGVVQNNITTYTKSGCSKKYGTTTKNDQVFILGYADGNTQILYPCSDYFKAAWIQGTYTISNGRLISGNASESTASSLDNLVGQTIADMGSTCYSSENLSYNGGYKGQCTWYAYGRFLELTGIKLKTAPNAKKWLSANSNDERVSVLYGSGNIRAKSIAVRKTGTYGHVMIVEDVTYENGSPAYVYFTECNTDGNGRYDAGKDCILKKMSYADFIAKKNPAGYIAAK